MTRVIGNWKMHGSSQFVSQLLAELVALPITADVAVCPPLVYLDKASTLLNSSRIQLGAQNLSSESEGAYTGEVSAAMLQNIGCALVLVGHSERRQLLGETNSLVAAKVDQAVAAGLRPVVCVGETLAEREAGQTLDIVRQQLIVLSSESVLSNKLILAYEPVWAIGTGMSASAEQAQEVHAFIRKVWIEELNGSANVEILYGGSVKPENAAELFAQADINGGLIGGASLKADDFAAIIKAAE